MGAIEKYLLVGSQSPWDGSYAQGFYLLRNDTGFNNTLIFTALPAVPARKVMIDVFATGPGAYTGAGLVVNRETGDGDWLGVTLEANNTLGIYQYNKDGLTRITQLPAQGLRSDLVTRLSLENSPSGIDIMTNGNKCGNFSDVKLKGAHGAMATDRGSFYMANFWAG